jgi:hypothetical protein
VSLCSRWYKVLVERNENRTSVVFSFMDLGHPQSNNLYTLSECLELCTYEMHTGFCVFLKFRTTDQPKRRKSFLIPFDSFYCLFLSSFFLSFFLPFFIYFPFLPFFLVFPFISFYMCYTWNKMGRVSSGSIVSDYWLDDRAIGARSPAGAKDFYSLLCVHTGSGAHPASCPMGTGDPFPGDKARPRRDADHSPHLVPRSGMSRCYNSSPPKRLRGV